MTQHKLFNVAGVADRQRLRASAKVDRRGFFLTVSASEQRPLMFPPCSPTLYITPVPEPPMKLSKKAIEEGLDTLPMQAILGKRVSDGLTPKQREFARKVAQGKSKAQAYREAFNPNPAPSTIITTPYKVASDPRVQREIEAYALAIEAEKHRSPAALRSLVIQTLTQVLIDPDAKPAVRINAAKVLGTVTEVAAFTERKEVRTISSSEDARARVMSELRALVSNGAEDATVIEADSLLAELTGDKFNAEPDETPPTPGPPNV